MIGLDVLIWAGVAVFLGGTGFGVALGAAAARGDRLADRALAEDREVSELEGLVPEGWSPEARDLIRHSAGGGWRNG